MTWARGFSNGYELQMTEEGFGRQDYQTGYSSATNTPKSGSRSARAIGEVSGTGWFVPQSVAIRGNFWLQFETTFAVTSGSLLDVLGQSLTNFEASVHVNNDEEQLEAYVAGSLVDTIGFQESRMARYAKWMCVGFHVKSGASGFLDFYVDGVLTFSISSALMNSLDGAIVMGATTFSGWGGQTVIDDFYLDYGDGTETREPPPAHRYLYSNTNAAGTSADWTPSAGSNEDNVDDAAPDGDDTHNRSDADDDYDTFNTADITVPAHHSIVSAIPTVIARKASVADSVIKLVVYDGATTKESASGKFVPMDYDIVQDRFTTDADGDAWTESEFNSSEFGYASAGVT